MRTQVERLVGDPVADSEWDLLTKDGWVSRALRGEISAAQLAQRVMEVREAIPHRPRPRAQSSVRLDDAKELARRAATRAEALSALLAIDAARTEEVVSFRREVLRGRLVKPERVGAWVERREAEQPVPAPTSASRPLPYALPDSEWVQWARVAPDSKLDRLRVLGEKLATRYVWQPAQASTFVLTDLTPLLAPIREFSEIRFDTDAEGRRMTATSRVKLDIDPTLTKEEVADYYAALQGSLLATRSRRQSSKHLQLAIYAYAHQDGSWEARRTGWNKLHSDPKWRYENYGDFKRDSRAAIKRLLEPPFEL